MSRLQISIESDKEVAAPASVRSMSCRDDDSFDISDTMLAIAILRAPVPSVGSAPFESAEIERCAPPHRLPRRVASELLNLQVGSQSRQSAVTVIPRVKGRTV
jgi:hypothetical protein